MWIREQRPQRDRPHLHGGQGPRLVCRVVLCPSGGVFRRGGCRLRPETLEHGFGKTRKQKRPDEKSGRVVGTDFFRFADEPIKNTSVSVLSTSFKQAQSAKDWLAAVCRTPPSLPCSHGSATRIPTLFYAFPRISTCALHPYWLVVPILRDFLVKHGCPPPSKYITGLSEIQSFDLASGQSASGILSIISNVLCNFVPTLTRLYKKGDESTTTRYVTIDEKKKDKKRLASIDILRFSKDTNEIRWRCSQNLGAVGDSDDNEPEG
jgi:hypothetical protein